MSTRSLGRLTLDIVAKVGGFVAGMDQAARVAKDRMDGILKLSRQVGTVIGTSLSAVAGFATLATKQVIDTAASLENFARVAGSGVQEFQKWGVAAETVGISQEKLSDQLKDFNEKLGEFYNSGGGGMRDFFEQIAPKIGITAEAFRGLSGPQGLQLYYDSLEKAGLGQQQMSFYLESMASDTTALIPLLRDGGNGFDEMGRKAQDLGAILDQETLEAAKRAKEEFLELDMAKKGLSNRIAKELLPALVSVTDKINKAAVETDLLDKVSRTAATGVKLFASVGAIVAGVFQTVGEALGGVASTVVQFISGEFQAAVNAFGESRIDIVKNVVGTVDAVKSVWDDAKLEGRPLTEAATADLKLAGSQYKKEGKKVVSEAEKVYRQVEEAIKRIRDEITTFNMSDEEKELFNLAGMGADAPQLERAKGYLAERKALEDAKKAHEDYTKALDEEYEAGLAHKEMIEGMLSDLEFETELLGMSNDERERAIALRYAGVSASEAEREAILSAVSAMQEEREQIGKTVELMDTVRDAGKGFITDMLSGTKSFKDGIKDAFDQIHKKILDMIAENLIDQLFGQKGQAGGGTSGNWMADIAGALFSSGGRAGGGSVKPWSIYQVNETGMEGLSVNGKDYLMTGSQSGIVQSNPRTGQQMITNNLTVNGRIDRRSEQRIAREIAQQTRLAAARA